MVATAAVSWPDYQTDEVELAGSRLVVDPAGILWWPAERLLAVSDLHFEKASSFARYGALLPPFDTAATLARLREAIMRYRPRTVLALGDSFHDGGVVPQVPRAGGLRATIRACLPFDRSRGTLSCRCRSDSGRRTSTEGLDRPSLT